MSSNDTPHVEAQASPDPATTSWVPIWNMGTSPQIPTPVVNGQWLSGVGGAAVWSPMGTRVSTTVAAVNTDVAWVSGNAHTIYDQLVPSAGSSVRSYGAPPAGAGTRLVLRVSAGTSVTIKHNITTGTGAPFWLKGSIDFTMLPGEVVEFFMDNNNFWTEIGRDSLQISYNTVLPTGIDGQEAVLVDNVVNPTYQWRFRYNAGSSSAYKWEFIGGPPAVSMVGASENCASASLVDLATVGPQIIAPRAGDYYGEASALLGQGAAASYNAGFQVAAIGILGATMLNGAGTGWIGNVMANGRGNSLGSGAVIKMQYYTANSNVNFQQRVLAVWPVRVS